METESRHIGAYGDPGKVSAQVIGCKDYCDVCVYGCKRCGCLEYCHKPPQAHMGGEIATAWCAARSVWVR